MVDHDQAEEAAGIGAVWTTAAPRGVAPKAQQQCMARRTSRALVPVRARQGGTGMGMGMGTGMGMGLGTVARHTHASL